MEASFLFLSAEFTRIYSREREREQEAVGKQRSKSVGSSGRHLTEFSTIEINSSSSLEMNFTRRSVVHTCVSIAMDLFH